MRFSLQARVVYPVDGPPIEHGVVTIEGGRIVSVGGAGSCEGPVRDLGNVAILPGLVNAHTHLEFSHLTRPLGRPGMKLAEWIRLVIAERQGRTAAADDSISAGIHESVRAGVTTIGDIASQQGARNAEREAKSDERETTCGETDQATAPLHGTQYSELGTPYSTLCAPSLVQFLEVIAFSRARAASALAAATQQLDTQFDAKESVDDPSNAKIGISPHAPYTVSPELLQELVALSNEYHLPVAMHVAESADELELLRDGTGPFRDLLEERSMWDAAAIRPGSRPLDYLRILAAAPWSLVIHGNYLEADERAFLADNADRMTLVYCPRTHAYFGHPAYPLADLIDRGVRVAIGTDSRASNPDLNLWAELLHVAVAHPAVDPAAILRMATLEGARALGLDRETGSLTPGKRADIMAMPLTEDARCAPSETLRGLVSSPTVPCAVWTCGRELPMTG